MSNGFAEHASVVTDEDGKYVGIHVFVKHLASGKWETFQSDALQVLSDSIEAWKKKQR